jgi:hypothetical protein
MSDPKTEAKTGAAEPVASTDLLGCDCRGCRNRKTGDWLMFQRPLSCAECGNKRCPKATRHQLKCTRSNDPGQLGSVYAEHGSQRCRSLTHNKTDNANRHSLD